MRICAEARTLEIACSSRSYPVVIGSGLIEDTLAEPIERVWIVDDFFADRFRPLGLDPIFIHADEPAKSLDRMSDVITALMERGASRETQLVAVGGGVVQDVSAFVASIYRRGVEYIYLPTTLLSMVDSCIGGKSSLNVGEYKNIVGTITPPSAVRIDPAFTATLSREQVAEGLCEAAKICLAGGADRLKSYLALAPSIDADGDVMAAVISHALNAKAQFIELDEFDQKERLLLNFGHTFGHAIEAASAFRISHGIGVGVGMLAAIELGRGMGRTYADAPHILVLIEHIESLLGAIDGLDHELRTIDSEAFMRAFEFDKKHSQRKLVVIMATEAGTLERTALPRDDVHRRLIANAFRAVVDRNAPECAGWQQIMVSIYAG